jgi:hypothetical protein
VSLKSVLDALRALGWSLNTKVRRGARKCLDSDALRDIVLRRGKNIAPVWKRTPPPPLVFENAQKRTKTIIKKECTYVLFFASGRRCTSFSRFCFCRPWGR